MHFCQIFELLKLLTGRENGSQNCLPEEKKAIKISYRKGKWLLKLLTRREIGFQNGLQEKKMPLKKALRKEYLAIKYSYRT